MNGRKTIIAPSLLAADFTRIAEAVRIVEESGGDWLHLDVMDGSFVPPISFGAQMASAVRSITTLPLDVHLMTLHPGTHLDSFTGAGADRLTFHVEAEVHAHRLIQEIRSRGKSAGISIVPSTPVTAIAEMLRYVDQVLVMTVNPGWGGQVLIPETLDKVRELDRRRQAGEGDFLICIDGGFGPETASMVWDAGVDVAVMGSAFFGSPEPRSAMRACRPSN